MLEEITSQKCTKQKTNTILMALKHLHHAIIKKKTTRICVHAFQQREVNESKIWLLTYINRHTLYKSWVCLWETEDAGEVKEVIPRHIKVALQGLWPLSASSLTKYQNTYVNRCGIKTTLPSIYLNKCIKSAITVTSHISACNTHTLHKQVHV